MQKALSFRLVQTEKSQAPNTGGGYWDYFVSGQSLKEYLGISESSDVTPIGSFHQKPARDQALRRLRLQERSDLIDNRVELYICSACGDIGCGSVTVKVEDRGDKIVWKDFATSTNQEEAGIMFNAEPLEFERKAYFSALAQLT